MGSKPLLVTATVLVFLGGAGWLAFHSASSPTTLPAPDPTAGKSMAAAAPSPSIAPAPTRPSVPPTVRPDANANVASVAEATRTGKFPERLSPLMAPKAFDPSAFAANPQAYLDIIEPGRVFQSAAPGLDVPVLRSKATASFEIPTGGACTLAVITAPRSPVTFTALDLGTFPNSLTSITVQADEQGEASTVYSASGGVIADAQILVGSPGASGQIKFHVFVTSPPVAAVVKP